MADFNPPAGTALDSLAVRRTTETRTLSSGASISIPALVIRFSLAERKLPRDSKYFGDADKNLRSSYSSKPLVDLEGETLFGELAIVRLLMRDGWSAVWVDSYHSTRARPLFWRDLPTRSAPVDLEREAPSAFELYDKLCAANGGRGGFFDVMAWREGRFLFVEYKGAGDKPNQNELRWIESALKSGIPESALLFVLY